MHKAAQFLRPLMPILAAAYGIADSLSASIGLGQAKRISSIRRANGSSEDCSGSKSLISISSPPEGTFGATGDCIYQNFCNLFLKTLLMAPSFAERTFNTGNELAP